jgi:hypothetical protein
MERPYLGGSSRFVSPASTARLNPCPSIHISTLKMYPTQAKLEWGTVSFADRPADCKIWTLLFLAEPLDTDCFYALLPGAPKNPSTPTFPSILACVILITRQGGGCASKDQRRPSNRSCRRNIPLVGRRLRALNTSWAPIARTTSAYACRRTDDSFFKGRQVP